MIEIYMGKNDKMYVDDSFYFLKDRLDNIVVYAKLLGFNFNFLISSKHNGGDPYVFEYTYYFYKDKITYSINFKVNRKLELRMFYLSNNDTYRFKYVSATYLNKLLDKLTEDIGKEREDESYYD